VGAETSVDDDVSKCVRDFVVLFVKGSSVYSMGLGSSAASYYSAASFNVSLPSWPRSVGH